MKIMKNYIKTVFVLFCLLFSAMGVSAQQLEEYLEIAAKNNPEVKASYSKFEAALQKAPQVSSLPDPTLTMSAFGRMVETRLGAQEARFSLMQMFPWFGTLELKENTAVLMAEAKFQQFLESRESLFLKVKTAYSEIYELKKILELREENIEILESYRKLALNKFEAGSAPMVNVVKVDIKKDEAQTQIEIMEAQLETLKKQFNLLLNRETEAEVVMQDTLVNSELLPAISGAEELNFEDHPKVEMLEREVAAYENEKAVAQKEGFPMLGLGLDYVIISERTDANPAMNGQDAIMPMFSVSLPVFRKKYRAAKEEARLMAEASKQQKEAVINEMKSEAEMETFRLQKSQRLIELYERQINSSAQANKLLISGFSNANSDFEEVLQMNQDILMFQIEKVSAVTETFKAASRLQFLLYKNNTDENE